MHVSRISEWIESRDRQADHDHQLPRIVVEVIIQLIIIIIPIHTRDKFPIILVKLRRYQIDNRQLNVDLYNIKHEPRMLG